MWEVEQVDGIHESSTSLVHICTTCGISSVARRPTLDRLAARLTMPVSIAIWAMAGCLIPAILMILGAAVGAIVGGDGGSVYGAFIGLAVGMLAMVVLVFLMSMAKR